MMTQRTELPEWQALAAHHCIISKQNMLAWFCEDPLRFDKFSLNVADILLDYSKNRISDPFRNKGVYLIVGGANGIGHVISQYLAKTYQSKLIWVGRSPENQHQEKMTQIKVSGGDILYCQADVSDRTAMEVVIQKAKSHFGIIHGAIHSALVLKDKTITYMNDEEFKSALSPKVLGSIVFYDVLKNESLDFLLYLSSLQSLIGNIGQSNYAAGCTFQDAWSNYTKHKPVSH